MKVQIKLDQAGKPAGSPGLARQDLATGVKVVASSVGGPFLQHRWELIDAPINYLAGAASACGIVSPAAAATDVMPIDLPQSYKLRLTVDSGSGLGATDDDVADITFYAGPTISALPYALPQRKPAFSEQTEHNVDLGGALGRNPKGWKETMEKWFLVIEQMYGVVATLLGVVGTPTIEEVSATVDGQTVFDISHPIKTAALGSVQADVNGLVLPSSMFVATNIGGHGRVTYVPTGDAPTMRAGWVVQVRYARS